MNINLQNYIKSGYRSVEGWYSQDSLRIINHINSYQINNLISGNIAEIGVHHGRSLILLSLMMASNEKCFAIDLFENQFENPELSGKGNLAIVKNNLTKFNCPIERIEIISSNSKDVNADYLIGKSGEKIRFFSLDGGHSADVVESDLKLAEYCLAKGGIALLDDYFDQSWPGVSEGLMRHLLLNDSNLIPFAIFDDKIMMTNSRELIIRYQEHLNKLQPEFLIKSIKFMDADCIVISKSNSKIKDKLRQSKLWQIMKNKNIGKLLRKSVK
ncbi:MAG: class I SAM-dependent methyltransferase [Candidatus Kapabacteria bacterium]|nr:class I SAM-dependent methyltransferase [Ignavibacteriota bacterium]MCW5883943.1 class I SAM-dependent methyltransferase [Candidatus Kapabacteria bacterium]